MNIQKLAEDILLAPFVERCKSCGAPLYALRGCCTQCCTVQAPSEYPVTCYERYYDAASKLIEDEPNLFSHDNANQLGELIQKWIEKKRDNYEPRD